MNDKLRPCPFCGNSDVRVNHNSASHYFYVWCVSCNSCGPQVPIRASAIEEWNHRADDEPDEDNEAQYVKTWGR